MSKEQKPIAIGTEFAAGTVKAINNDHVLLDTKEGVKRFSFHKLKGSAMNNDLYHKRNERKVFFLCPKYGSKNILRSVNGVRLQVSLANWRDYRLRGQRLAQVVLTE